MKSLSFMLNSFNLNLGKFHIPVPYWQAVAIVFLIFVLILTLANFRKHYIDWSLKGGIVGIFFGFLLALILEGFLLIGGRTAITEVLGWKNAPAPLAQVLDAGRSGLIKVLGVNTEIPSSFAKENSTVTGAMETIQALNPADLSKVKNILCTP